MKNTKKLIVFLIAIFALMLISPNLSQAATPITDESSLLSAISSADSGATITLQNNITVTAPIVIQKELTINGNGYTVTGSSDWTSTSGNQTMFTAQFAEGKLTLKNINLQNGPKYGVQSYDGATVILDNVSITGFRYGGVLANGGKIEVRDLHLGYNGTGANNGIEIDKGAAATNNPTLVMNGTLKSDTNENVVRVAENGSLTEFTITNTPNTTNKVVLAGDSVVLTDKQDNVISESKIPEKATPNVDIQKVVVSLVVNDKTYKITVDSGTKLTDETIKSHIKIDEGYEVEGYYTDVDFKNKYDLNTAITQETTIFVKLTEVKEEVVVEEPKTEEKVEKDNTPKTGVENYTGIAIITLIFAIAGLVVINNRSKRG